MFRRMFPAGAAFRFDWLGMDTEARTARLETIRPASSLEGTFETTSALFAIIRRQFRVAMEAQKGSVSKWVATGIRPPDRFPKTCEYKRLSSSGSNSAQKFIKTEGSLPSLTLNLKFCSRSRRRESKLS